jgi:hypothetical protein
MAIKTGINTFECLALGFVLLLGFVIQVEDP